MTTACMLFALLPILWSAGTGADVMKRIAAPLVGGILNSFVLGLLVYPPIFAIWKWNFEVKPEIEPAAATAIERGECLIQHPSRQRWPISGTKQKTTRLLLLIVATAATLQAQQPRVGHSFISVDAAFSAFQETLETKAAEFLANSQHEETIEGRSARPRQRQAGRDLEETGQWKVEVYCRHLQLRPSRHTPLQVKR